MSLAQGVVGQTDGALGSLADVAVACALVAVVGLGGESDVGRSSVEAAVECDWLEGVLEEEVLSVFVARLAANLDDWRRLVGVASVILGRLDVRTGQCQW